MLDRGVVEEHLANTDVGVEQTFEFAERPPGTGDLTIRMQVRGPAYVGETDSGLHFWDDSAELGVRYGHGVWLDDRGAEIEVRATWEEGTIVLRVPAAAVDSAVYPAVLDPVIGPELGTDEPVIGPALDDQMRAATSSDGTDYFVVWQDQRWSADYNVWGARVRASDGLVLDKPGILISNSANDEAMPAVAFDGANYLVVWQDDRSGTTLDIYCARVNATDGSLLDTNGIAVSTAAQHQTNPAVSFGGGNYLVVWQDARISAAPDIFAARVRATDGVVIDYLAGIPVSATTGDQVNPAVAYDGANFLVVWQDRRSGTTYDIYGSRMSGSDGSVLDGAGIPISTATNTQQSPDVATDGNDFLVVWTDQRSGSDIYGARVRSSDGSVLDDAGIPISTASRRQSNAAVASDGTNYLVAWADSRAGDPNIYGTRVQSDGSVLDTDGFAISLASKIENYPAVSSNGTNYLVAWDDYSLEAGTGGDVHGTRVNAADGSVIDPAAFPIATDANEQGGPAVAFDGASYLVVWLDYRAVTNRDVYGARIDAVDGSVLDAAGIAISTADGDQSNPAVAFDGTDYIVVWSDARWGTSYDIYGARVRASDGSVLDAAGFPIATELNDQQSPDVVCGGADYFVVWHDYRSGTASDLYGARVRQADLWVIDQTGIPVSTASNDQSNPAVAYDGANYLVVWDDRRSGTYYDIYGARVRASDGSVLDAIGIPISTASRDDRNPDVAYDGASYMVVWDRRVSYTDIYGARVRASDGAVLDSSGLSISTASRNQRHPAIAYDGPNHLVVWQDDRSTTSEDVFGAIVRASDGSVLDPTDFVVSADASDETAPVVAAGTPGRFLVAYQRPDASLGVPRVKPRLVASDVPAGEFCSEADECASGYCADGVCCDDACGESDPTDCLACSISAGGTTDGACVPAMAGTVCRPSQSSCDPAETCDGASPTCPDDYVEPSGTGCDDSNACTEGDTCDANGACVAGSELECSDGNLCTDDGCNPATGCMFTNNSDACDDGNACTIGDACDAGNCVGGAPPACDDANDCTDDSCNPTTGCVFTNNSDACDDGDACTTGETCAAGICVGGSPLTCDDANDCTEDSCNPTTGCVFTNNSDACDDGNACTQGDHCSGGACVTAPVNCDDGNICTDDGCNPAIGCVFTNNSAACDDGNACTHGDSCTSGVCVEGAPLACDDANGCTEDSCNPTIGCVFADKSGACDDGNACTTGDACDEGNCVGGAPLACDDANDCTDDSCNPTTGCVYTNNSDACDDGDECTAGDTCAAGICVGGVPLTCDDANDCTDDSCNPTTGCVFTNNAMPCDDGDACTQTDICAGGSCVGADPVACSASDDCHEPGTCDPATGACSNPIKTPDTDNDGIPNACDTTPPADEPDGGCSCASEHSVDSLLALTLAAVFAVVHRRRRRSAVRP